MLKVRERNGAGPAGPVPFLRLSPAGAWVEHQTRALFLLPAVLMLVFLSIFPLFVSLYLSLTRFQFVPGGFQLVFVGLNNYRKLIAGIERGNFWRARGGTA